MDRDKSGEGLGAPESTENMEEIYLTKERLLKGIRLVEEVRTRMGIFKVRPLTEGEKARVESLSVRGIKAKGNRQSFNNMDLEMEMEKVVENEWEVRCHILAAGLSVDKANTFTVGDIKSLSLDKEVSTQLVTQIRSISGMPRPEEVLRRFRAITGGQGSISPDIERPD